jgi:hypothetical protein
MKKFFILIIISCLFYSCSPLFNGIYGLKKQKTLSQNQIQHTARKYSIPVESSFVLDTTFFTYLGQFDSLIYQNSRNNHAQPLQVLYFDSLNQLVSYQVNCYAGGFPNLKWNRNNAFENFPPSQQAPIDSLISFEKQLYFIKSLNGTNEKLILNDSSLTVFVYWNRFMGRQSKRLIKLVQKNAALAKDNNLQVIYINNDNIYSNKLK